MQAPLALCQSSYLLGGIIDVVGWGHCGLILAYAQVGRSESDDFVDDDDDDDKGGLQKLLSGFFPLRGYP